MDKETIDFVKKGLRALSYKYSARTAAKRLARTGRNQYTCACCGGTFGNKEIQLDHKIPVGTLITWDEYIKKLFCAVNGFQVLCKPCHKAKTAREAGERAEIRKAA